MIRNIRNQIENEMSPAQLRGLNQINKLIKQREMTQRQKLRNHILNYMAENELNTYKLRLMLQKGKKPLGIGINTVNKILKDDNYQPSRFALIKLLRAIKVEYIQDCGIIIIK